MHPKSSSIQDSCPPLLPLFSPSVRPSVPRFPFLPSPFAIVKPPPSLPLPSFTNHPPSLPLPPHPHKSPFTSAKSHFMTQLTMPPPPLPPQHLSLRLHRPPSCLSYGGYYLRASRRGEAWQHGMPRPTKQRVSEGGSSSSLSLPLSRKSAFLCRRKTIHRYAARIALVVWVNAPFFFSFSPSLREKGARANEKGRRRGRTKGE